jgi:hypothetical protein
MLQRPAGALEGISQHCDWISASLAAMTLGSRVIATRNVEDV